MFETEADKEDVEKKGYIWMKKTGGSVNLFFSAMEFFCVES